MIQDDGVRCDRHVGEVFPPRCHECDVARREARAPGGPSFEAALAELVRNAIEGSHASLDEIAGAVQIDRESLERQLDGSREFTVSEIVRVARAVDADPVVLLRRATELSSPLLGVSA